MIIGICGLIGSGKGTAADMLVSEQGFHKVSFADSLKDCVGNVFGWPRHLLEGDTDDSRNFREKVDPWWAERLGMPGLTPREVLQKWGTEVCRNGWHQDIWILSMERKMRDLTSNIVIPDVRFPNEVDMVHRLGGQVWEVMRGEQPLWYVWARSFGKPEHFAEAMKVKYPEVHSSEWAWRLSHKDHIIRNDGSVDDLRSTISSLISQ
jgi:hypothetical protein